MLNPFVIRKWLAVLLPAFLGVVCWTLGNLFYGLWVGLGVFFVGVLVSVALSFWLLSDPFRRMLEGKGLLGIDLNSTGVLRVFNVAVRPPLMEGRVGDKVVTDVFDRSAVHNLAVPVKGGQAMRLKDGGFRLELSEEEYNQGRFAMFHYPVVIFNSALNSFLTKDWLSEKEMDGFAKHGILYQNRMLEELTKIVRDFGRYVVELTRPQGSFLKSMWFRWVAFGVVLVLLAVLFGGPIINAVKGVAPIAGGAVKGAVGGAIVPVG